MAAGLSRNVFYDDLRVLGNNIRQIETSLSKRRFDDAKLHFARVDVDATVPALTVLLFDCTVKLLGTISL